MVVALNHGGHGTESLAGISVEIPYGLSHRVVMRIHNIIAMVTMPGQMNLLHALDGQIVQKLDGVEAVIDAADVDVIRLVRPPGVKIPIRSSPSCGS